MVNLVSLPFLRQMSPRMLKKSTKNSKTIGQIIPKLPSTLKYRVTLIIQEKLLNNLAMKVNGTGIQNVLHFKFIGVISLRA